MKLRIKDDSLRLRLTQGEVREFSNVGSVQACIRLDMGATLVYRLTHDEGAAAVTATFNNDTISVRVPTDLALHWWSTDDVALRIDGNDRVGPRITVEKDFACLQPRTDEDESDHYPNPQASNCDASSAQKPR